MKRVLVLTMLGLLAALVGATGCTIHGVRPAVVVSPAPVVAVTAPPARVYHNGHWLYYRSDGYYYYYGGSWVAASAVPHYVSHYHRPVARTRVYRHRHVRPVHSSRRVYRVYRKGDAIKYFTGGDDLKESYR